MTGEIDALTMILDTLKMVVNHYNMYALEKYNLLEDSEIIELAKTIAPCIFPHSLL